MNTSLVKTNVCTWNRFPKIDCKIAFNKLLDYLVYNSDCINGAWSSLGKILMLFDSIFINN